MVWSPGALKENDAGNGYWQMVSPKLEKSCSVFGENGNYAWTLWRPYRCCEIKGGVFMVD
jgi:hypothetical protein